MAHSLRGRPLGGQLRSPGGTHARFPTCRPLPARSTAHKAAASASDLRTVIRHPVRTTLTLLRNLKNGAEIYLLGTRHTSQRSAAEVREVIYTEMPSVIFVEMDKERYHHLKPYAITQLYRRYMGSSLMDASDEDMALFRGRVAGTAPLDMGVDASAEEEQDAETAESLDMMAAIEAFYELHWQKHPIELVLGDQHHRSTTQQMAIAAVQDAVGRVATGPLAISMDTKFDGDIDAASSVDAYGAVMGAAVNMFVDDAYDRGVLGLRDAARLRTEYRDKLRPMFNKALVHRRDEHMVNKILKVKGVAVAIVGVAHMDGIEERWAEAMRPVQGQLVKTAEAKQRGFSMSSQKPKQEQQKQQRKRR